MTYGLMISPDGVQTVDFSEQIHYKELQKVVGGPIEVVHPRRLPEPYVMICNEVGRLVGLTANPVASWFYETDKHGQPIVGTVVILREEETGEGVDLVSLKGDDLMRIAGILERGLAS